MSIKDLEKIVVEKLKKYEDSYDNRLGIMYSLKRSNNHMEALNKMNIYLDREDTSKTRNDMIEYALMLSKTV